MMFFYAMSHGVNRATLKEGKTDDRVNFLNKLIKKSNGIKYDFLWLWETRTCMGQ